MAASQENVRTKVAMIKYEMIEEKIESSNVSLSGYLHVLIYV